MAQAGKGKLNYRCPSCFMRDIDMDMFYDKDKKVVFLLILIVEHIHIDISHEARGTSVV